MEEDPSPKSAPSIAAPPKLASNGEFLSDILVHVRKADGTLVEIHTSKGSTIAELKEAISIHCGASSLSQKLIHKTTVMCNDELIASFSGDDALPLEVTMVVLPLGGVLESMEALCLTKRVDAVPTSTVQEMSATLANCTGVTDLPAHFTMWFQHLLENGLVLSFFDPRECLSHPERHSHGSLCLSRTEEHLGPCTADECCILDATDGDGPVSLYADFDALYRNCAEWKQQGKLVQTWGSLSEYFMFKVERYSEKMRATAEHDQLTKFGTCVKIQCMLPSTSGDEFEKRVLTPEFTPEFEAYTVSALKTRVAEMTSMAPDKMKVICAGKTLEDSRQLTDYGIRGGSTLHVVVSR